MTDYNIKERIRTTKTLSVFVPYEDSPSGGGWGYDAVRRDDEVAIDFCGSIKIAYIPTVLALIDKAIAEDKFREEELDSPTLSTVTWDCGTPEENAEDEKEMREASANIAIIDNRDLWAATIPVINNSHHSATQVTILRIISTFQILTYGHMALTIEAYALEAIRQLLEKFYELEGSKN